MCLLITGVFPARVCEDALGQLLSMHRMSPEPLGNPHVTAQLRPRERYVSLTIAHCDCGCPLFSYAARMSLPPPGGHPR